MAERIKGKQVLVTGAGGFIGSHLVEMLVSEGADVRALVHYNSRNDWAQMQRVSRTDGLLNRCFLLYSQCSFIWYHYRPGPRTDG